MKVIDVAIIFLTAWKTTVRKKSYECHSRTFLLHLQPIADINIENLTLEMLQKHILDLEKKLKLNTVSQWQNMIKRSFSYSQKIGLINENVASNLLPIRRKVNKAVNVISEKQFLKLLIETNKFRNIEDLEEKKLFLELLFRTGLRHSEARALQVFKFNFDEKTLTVNNSIYCDYKGKWELTETKTASSSRIIKIDNVLANKIKVFIEKKNKKNKDFIFAYKDGEPRTASFAKALLTRACKKIGISISTHGLRHSHATFLRSMGIDLEKIQLRLGHSNILVTQKIYSHIKLNNENDIIDILEKIC